MRAMDLKKAVETLGNQANLDVYLRSGVKITGSIPAFNDGSAVCVHDVGGKPAIISVEAIDAVQWAGD
jgi:sRNA-binding regulator protein Hfq